MKAKTETEIRWYYEERIDGIWMSAYWQHGYSCDRIVELMERAKKRDPKAVLRLCYSEVTRASYRNRHEFSQPPF